MPIKHAIWKVGKEPEPLKEIGLASELQLEDMIVARPAILSDDWMLIGRQEITELGGRIDLLALAPDASVVLIELKRKLWAQEIPGEIFVCTLDWGAFRAPGDEVCSRSRRHLLLGGLPLFSR